VAECIIAAMCVTLAQHSPNCIILPKCTLPARYDCCSAVFRTPSTLPTLEVAPVEVREALLQGRHLPQLMLMLLRLAAQRVLKTGPLAVHWVESVLTGQRGPGPATLKV
jgi:hypothetical protein